MLEKNTNLLIGKMNTGKTRGILLKEVDGLINNNENILVLDNKEEYYKTFGEKLKEKGYNTYVLNLKDPTKSNGFNPLMLPYAYYKNGNIDKAVKLINDLGHTIFKSNSSDPFWDNSASDYFAGLVLTLFKEGKEEEINLGSIGMILAKVDTKIGDTTAFKKYLSSLDPLNIIYVFSASSEFAPYETRASILSVMRQKLNLFLTREGLLNVLNNNELKIKDKTAMFIIGEYNLNVISNILINQVFSYIKDSKIKFNFILDDFDLLPQIDNLKEMINDSYYHNLKLDIAFKDISEMESLYGKFIFNHIENIINMMGNYDLMEIGNYNEYPTIKKGNNKYFDFEKFINDKKRKN